MARHAPQSTLHRRIHQAAGPDQEVTPSWNRPEVLLVEDGTGIFEEIGYILQEQGFLVLLAPDPQTALQEVGNYQVDVVMVSATRQNPAGLRVLDRAKQLNPEVVTVVLTQGYGRDLPVEAYESEVDCYLGWPVLPGDLGRRLMNLLAVDLLEENPRPPIPAGKVDRRVWFQLGRFVYEVWTALDQAGDSLNSLHAREGESPAENSAPQVRNLSRIITRLTDAVEQFIRETPWPDLDGPEAGDDQSGFFQA
jgi:response regulator RpfG family c-di-GMP phosphodiesterase